MTDPGPPRDWDKELAEVDKAMARQTGPPSPRPVPPTAAGPAPVVARRSLALTWFRTALGVLLAIALPLWPYAKGCGLQLTFYVGAAALTFFVGLWGAVASWRYRRGFAHFLSLLTVVWAAILIAHEVLPRTGYAKAERTWLCP